MEDAEEEAATRGRGRRSKLLSGDEPERTAAVSHGYAKIPEDRTLSTLDSDLREGDESGGLRGTRRLQCVGVLCHEQVPPSDERCWLTNLEHRRFIEYQTLRTVNRTFENSFVDRPRCSQCIQEHGRLAAIGQPTKSSKLITVAKLI